MQRYTRCLSYGRFSDLSTRKGIEQEAAPQWANKQIFFSLGILYIEFLAQTKYLPSLSHAWLAVDASILLILRRRGGWGQESTFDMGHLSPHTAHFLSIISSLLHTVSQLLPSPAAVHRSRSHIHIAQYNPEESTATSVRTPFCSSIRPSRLEKSGLEAADPMQDLSAILLGYEALFVGYGASLLTYFILRRKAKRNSGGQSIIQIKWWRYLCYSLYTGLFSGAIIWSVLIAILFADLVSLLDQICPALITPDACRYATLNWRMICIALGEVAAAAFILIVYTTLMEAKRTVSTPERSYPLAILTSSHFLLVVSWLLCTPLTYPLKLFSLTGTKSWTRASFAFAALAVSAYSFGTALWIIALLRVFYTCRHRSRNRSPDRAQWFGGTEAHVAQQEDYEMETLDLVVPVEMV